MPDILRMRCPNKKRHPAILAIPEGAIVGPGGDIVLRTGRETGGRRWPYPVLCASAGSCSDFPVYGSPDAEVRLGMRACTVRGRPSARECGPACAAAVSLDCECACEGANHGLAYRGPSPSPRG